MLRNSSRSVLSLLRSNNTFPPTVSWCRRFFFSGNSLSPPPPRVTYVRPDQVPRDLPAAPWHHDRLKVATATALAAAGLYAAARLRYGETVPFTGRTHLALLSRQEIRDRDEARFAKFKKFNAPKILGPDHHDAVRVQRILDDIIRAAHRGHEDLHWIDGLDWEVIVVDDEKINTEGFPGAGKIVVSAGLLHHIGKDVEIAASLAHEVGHVIGRHSSGMLDWLNQIMNEIPILIPLIFAFIYRSNVDLVQPFQRTRRELEADHIGIMLLAAAGIDPHIAIQVRQRKAEMGKDITLKEYVKSTHPTTSRRWWRLSQSKVMDKAMELYKQVTSNVQG